MMQRCMGCMREFPDEFDVCPHCGYVVGTGAANRSHLEPGTVLQGRYTLGRVLGQGGFGITYIAWDNKIARAVAIKEYLPNGIASRVSGEKTVSCNSEKMQQFFIRGLEKTRRETIALSRFDTLESVVRVYDCIEENGTAYIIMELLRGKTVKQILKARGVMPFEACVRIMTPVLQTLDAMHEAGMIHRDVAPDNIFVCDDRKVKLLDFGAARVVSGTDDKSLSVMLKHGYAPLEQYSSKGRQGPFTDVYAACATMVCMLTGRAPDAATDRAVDDDLPQALDGVCTKAQRNVLLRGLSMRAEERPQSARELLDALQKTLPPPQKPQKEKREKKPKQKKEKPEKLPKDKTTAANGNRKFILPAVALVLVAAIVTGVVVGRNRWKTEPVGQETEADIVTFGSYPQSEVEDSSLLESLNALDADWKSYGYYSGTGSNDGKMKASDYMQYCDVAYAGERYRGVYFTQYRPNYNSDASSAENSHQDDNGYEINAVYWFRYDPLEWRVLDADAGLMLCETIIDSQPYNNYILAIEEGEEYEYYSDAAKTYYANDYAESSIRQWLNDDFYNTAFTKSEQAQIASTTLDNSAWFDDEYDSASTTDKVFLLSYADATNRAYGFSSYSGYNDSARQSKGSAYAQCQGLYIDENKCSYWWLRSAGNTSHNACGVYGDGSSHYYNYSVRHTFIGIRPALKLNR